MFYSKFIITPLCGRRAKRSGSWSQLFRCAKKLESTEFRFY